MALSDREKVRKFRGKHGFHPQEGRIIRDTLDPGLKALRNRSREQEKRDKKRQSNLRRALS